MHITLVIRKCNRETSNCSKTTRSLKHKDVALRDIIFVDKLSDIDYGKIKTDWWIVLHDDEMIEDRLLDAMIMGSKCENFDAFSFYKKDQDGRITICPRMFRNHVRLEKDHLYPIMPVRMETLLDGWVIEHDRIKEQCTAVEDMVLLNGQAEASLL